MSLFEPLDTSTWTRALEERAAALKHFDEGQALLTNATRIRNSLAIPMPGKVESSQTGKVSADKARFLAQQVEASAKLWTPANEALKKAVANRQQAETSFANSQVTQRYLIIALAIAGVILLMIIL
jgi:hypothetical protein